MRNIGFFAALFLAIFLLGCNQAEPIKIGFAGQLTGVYSDLGVQGRNGVQLAVEKLNASGGIDGRMLELIVKNDKNSVKGALEADTQLIQNGVVAIIGHMTSSQTLGVQGFIQDKEVPLISPTASSPLLKGKQDYIFRLNPSSDRSAAVMGEYAYTQLEKNRVAVLYDMKNQAYSLPYAQVFTDTFKKMGGTVPLQVNFSSDEGVDWDRVITRVDAHDIAAVMIVASAADTAEFAQKMSARGKKWRIFGSGWAYTQNLIQYGGHAVEGLVFTDSFNRNSTRPKFREFKQRYIERFGREPLFAATQGYESVLLLEQALRKRDAYDGNLREAMQNVRSIEGLMGTLHFDKYGDVKRPYFMSMVINGNFHIIESIYDEQ